MFLTISGCRNQFKMIYSLLSAVFAVGCFTPLLLNFRLTASQEDDLKLTLRREMVNDALISCFAVSSLFIFELWLDVFALYRPEFILRWLRVLSLLVPFLLIYLIMIPNAVACIFTLQHILFLYIFTLSISKYGSPVIGSSALLLTMTFLGIGITLSSITPFSTKSTSQSIYYVVLVCIATGALFALRNTYTWVLHIYRSCILPKKAMNHNQYCCTIYIITTTAYLLIDFVGGQIFVHALGNSRFAEKNFTMQIYLRMLFVVISSMLVDRVLKRDLASAQVYILGC